MPNFRIIVLALYFLTLPIAAAICAEAAPAKPEAVKAVEPKEEPTAAGFITRIKSNLGRLPELMNFIQGLKKEKDAARF